MEYIKSIIERSKTFAEIVSRKKAEGVPLTKYEQDMMEAVEGNSARIDKEWEATEEE